MYSNTDRYTSEQEELHRKIKLLHNEGLGYRRIANHLNQLEIKTIKGNTWNNTNVYSVLKKYKERQQRLILRDKVYETVWHKMSIVWQKENL